MSLSVASSSIASRTLGPAAATSAHVDAAFDLIDTNKDGVLSRAEVIRRCRADAQVRTLLGLPAVIRQADPSHAAFEAVFQQLDADGSRTITRDEFRSFFSSSPEAASESVEESEASEESPREFNSPSRGGLPPLHWTARGSSPPAWPE